MEPGGLHSKSQIPDPFRKHFTQSLRQPIVYGNKLTVSRLSIPVDVNNSLNDVVGLFSLYATPCDPEVGVASETREQASDATARKKKEEPLRPTFDK